MAGNIFVTNDNNNKKKNMNIKKDNENSRPLKTWFASPADSRYARQVSMCSPALP